jgi:hypothetical protein
MEVDVAGTCYPIGVAHHSDRRIGGRTDCLTYRRNAKSTLVKRVKEGPDRVVGRDLTDQSGAYRVPVQNPSGRFYAVATKKAGGAGGGGNCLKAASKKVRR